MKRFDKGRPLSVGAFQRSVNAQIAVCASGPFFKSYLSPSQTNVSVQSTSYTLFWLCLCFHYTDFYGFVLPKNLRLGRFGGKFS